MDTLIQIAHLTEEDLLNLSEKAIENLAIAFDSATQEAVDLKDRLKSAENIHRDALAKMEMECEKYRLESASAAENLADLRSSLSVTEKKLSAASNERGDLSKKLIDSSSITNELEMTIKNLENDKESLSELLNRKIGECEHLSTELNIFKSEIESARQMKSNTLMQMEELNAKKNLLELREARLSENSESAKQHTAWLEKQLHEANDKLLSIRRETTEKYLDLETELASRKSELENSRSVVKKLEDLVKHLTESNEDHIEKLKIRTDELMNLEELHAKELNAQKRLTDLYKNQASEAEKKLEEMTKAVTSMQEMLNQGHEHVLQLEIEKATIIDTLSSEKNQLLIKNQALTEELNTAKEIVDKFRIQGLSEDELRKLNPAVATTIASLKRGRSLTQIYSDYVQVVEERDLLKLDKERLTQHVREMVSQLEEKGPLLRSQQEAFFKSKTRVEELEVQLADIQAKCKEAQENFEDNKRRAGYFQRQNAKLKQSCSDMSSQVKTLLHELEVARGTVIRPDTSLCPDSSSGDSLMDDSRQQLQGCIAANKVIDKNLVTYRNLSELQSQNQKLLLVARDLANQLEERESAEDALATQVSDISTRLDVLSGEVNVARLAATEARNEAQLACRQRDELRSLLHKHSIALPDETGNESFKQVSVLSSSTDDISMLVHPDTSTANITMDASFAASVNNSKLEESLCSLHQEYKEYREDKAKTDEVYTTTIDKLRQEIAESKILNQKLAAQLDFTHEKFRTLEANVANYKQEITILREMNARYTTSAAASDEALTHLREQAARTSDRLTASEVECRQLACQLEASRANESRLENAIEMERRQGLQHTQLMNQLQSIQASLEHRESTEKRMAERRLAALEAELAEVKKIGERREEEAKALNASLQLELVFTQQTLKETEAELELVRKSLKEEQDRISSLTQAAAICTPSSHADGTFFKTTTQPTVPSTPTADDTATAADKSISSAHLRELQRECESLRVSLEANRRQCAEYQKLATEMEEHLANLTKEREDKDQAHAVEIENFNQRCEFLGLQLNLEKKERQDLVNENMRLIDESNKLRNDLKAELAAVQNELVSANERKQVALEVEAQAKSKIEAHQKTAQEAREKYETELKLHSQDVELLMEARKVADSSTSEIADLKAKLGGAQKELTAMKERAKVQEDLWDEERTKLTKRNNEANAEVDRLQEQILKLTEQLVSLRKLMEKLDDESFSREEAISKIQEAEDFTHVLEYLRRQKSIAEVAEEAANAEVSRLHMRTKQLEVQVADLTTRLIEEQKTSEMRAETSRQHANLMSQLEQINVLSESNRLLRQERETIRNSVVQAEARLAALHSEIEPIRAECQELKDGKELLISEAHSLAEERDLWKERCTRLVETSKRMDPEEYKQACNARDELQHRLQLVEEAKASAERATEARIDSLEQQIAELTATVAQFDAYKQASAEKYAELDAKYNAQRSELEKKQTNIIKLREIGRKYRQETDELKSKISGTQANEANLKTVKETLVAVQADLMNTQSNYEIERDRSAKLAEDAERTQHLIDLIEAHSTYVSLAAPIVPEAYLAPPEEGDGEYARLNRIVSALVTEVDNLRAEAENQRESLIRMRMIESQLTRAKRELANRSTSSAPAVSTSSAESHATVQLIPTDAENIEAGSTVTSSPLDTAGSPSMSTGSPAALTPGQHSWVMRAAATVQPVQTPLVQPQAPTIPAANSPFNRQTAEIRPITNNVATVLPTPTTLDHASHLTVISETTPANMFSSFPGSSGSAAPSTLFGVGQEVPSFLQSSRIPAQPLANHLFSTSGNARTLFSPQTSTTSPSVTRGTGGTVSPGLFATSLVGKRSYEEVAGSSPQLQPSTSYEPIAETLETPEGNSDAKRARSSIVNTTASTSRLSSTNTTQIVSPMSTTTTTVQSITVTSTSAPLGEGTSEMEASVIPFGTDETPVYQFQTSPGEECGLEDEEEVGHEEEEAYMLDTEPPQDEETASPAPLSLIDPSSQLYPHQVHLAAVEDAFGGEGQGEENGTDESSALVVAETGEHQVVADEEEEGDEEDVLGDVEGDEADEQEDDEEEESYEEEDDDEEEEEEEEPEGVSSEQQNAIIILSSDDEEDVGVGDEEEEGNEDEDGDTNDVQYQLDDVEHEGGESHDPNEAVTYAEDELEEADEGGDLEDDEHEAGLAVVEDEEKNVGVQPEPVPEPSVVATSTTGLSHIGGYTFSTPASVPRQPPSLFTMSSHPSARSDSSVLTPSTTRSVSTHVPALGGLFSDLSAPKSSQPATSSSLFATPTASPGLFSSMLTSSTSTPSTSISSVHHDIGYVTPQADSVASKQKIKPIVWSETNVSSHSFSGTSTTSFVSSFGSGGPNSNISPMFRLPTGSFSASKAPVLGASRRKNWGFSARGRGGHGGAPH